MTLPHALNGHWNIAGKDRWLISSDRFPPGQGCAKRMSPGQPLPLDFTVRPQLSSGRLGTQHRRLTAVVGIALMSPNAHNPSVGFGTALGEVGYSS